jgi:hypothetical protein
MSKQDKITDVTQKNTPNKTALTPEQIKLILILGAGILALIDRRSLNG